MALRAVINEVKASQDAQNLNIQVQILDENNTELKVFTFTQGPDNVTRELIFAGIVNFTAQHLVEEKRKADIAAKVTDAEVVIKPDLESLGLDLSGIEEVIATLKENEHIEDIFKPKVIQKVNPASGEIASVADGTLIQNPDGTVKFK